MIIPSKKNVEQVICRKQPKRGFMKDITTPQLKTVMFFALLTMIIIGSSLFLLSQDQSQNPNTVPMDTNDNTPYSNSNHTYEPNFSFVENRLEIVSNEDFLINAGINDWEGTGTALDPIIITGITYSAIYISDTDLFFCIINCKVISDTGGIRLYNVKNGCLSNNTITIENSNYIRYCYEWAIFLWESNNNTIVGNSIYIFYGDGILIYESANNTIIGNHFTNTGIQICGSAVEKCLQNDVNENLVNGKPLIWWQNIIGGTVPYGAGQIILINCTSVIVSQQKIEDVPLGISLSFNRFTSIINNTIISFSDGIQLFSSNNTLIRENTIIAIDELDEKPLERLYNIYLYRSNNNSIIDNRFFGDGLFFNFPNTTFLQYRIENNFINGKPLVYLQNKNGITISKDAGQIIMVNCSAIEISGCNLHNVMNGVSIHNCRNISIKENTFDHNKGRGILCEFSSNFTIRDNQFANNTDAIMITHCSNLMIANNTLINNSEYACFSMWGSNITFTNNVVANTHTTGVEFWYVYNSKIIGNIFYNNRLNALSLALCNSCLIEGNNFVVNSEEHQSESQAQDSSINNIFSNNYWSEWSSPDNNNDGIVDSSYAIYGYPPNEDPFPRTLPNKIKTNYTLIIPAEFTFSTNININGLRSFNGTMDITWTPAIDLAGNLLQYILYYSSDKGNSWNFLTSNYSITKYEWDTTTVPNGENYRLKLITNNSRGLIIELVSYKFQIYNEEKEDCILAISESYLITISIVFIGLGAIYRGRSLRNRKFTHADEEV